MGLITDKRARRGTGKLRNDNEIAEELFRLHGADSWAWHYMSKRLKKKYKIEEM